MIVVDSNVVAYCWLNTSMTPLAQRVRTRDADWHVPLLWRSEMRSVLTGYLRAGALSAAHLRRIMSRIEEELEGSEHFVASEDVFAVVAGSKLSAYDSEFVALAIGLSVPLVTEDRAILKEFPRLAMTMASFVEE